MIKDRFEKGISGNCLVIAVGNEEKFYSYQAEMIEHNPTPRLVPVEKRIVNNQILLYYRLGSLVPLSRYLAGAALDRNGFLHILESIMASLAEAKRYFLYERCFLLNTDYIYTDLSAQSVALLYVPIETDTRPDAEMKRLISDLLTALRAEKEESSENLLLYKKLAEFEHRETAVLTGLAQLLKELKLPRAIFCTQTQSDPRSKPFELEQAVVETGQLKEGVKPRRTKKHLILMALLQAAFLMILTAFSNKINSWHDPDLAYAGIALIIAGINALFIYRIFRHNTAGGCAGKEKREDEYTRWKNMVVNTLAVENGLIKRLVNKNMNLRKK